MKTEFLDYTPTPDEKHTGIATIRCIIEGLHRYKIIPKKDGSGFFPSTTSLKVGDSYVPSFEPERASDKNEIEKCIRDGLKKYNDDNKEMPF